MERTTGSQFENTRGESSSEPTFRGEVFTEHLHNITNVYDEPIKDTSAEWVFLLTNLTLEIMSAAFDQASSPSKPHYALFGMLLGIAALLTSMWELIYKGKKERVVWRRWGKMPCFYYPPPRNTLFATLPYIFGLVAGMFQCLCSIVQYICFIRHANNPFKLSLFPAIFLICLAGSRLTRNQNYAIDHNNNILMERIRTLQAALEPSNLELVFSKNLSATIFTESKIADEENNPLQILLVGKFGDQMVPISLSHPIQVEIVVLDGDFFRSDHNWTSEEFDNNILGPERTGRRPLLNGEVLVTLSDGVATINRDNVFTDNSSWIRSKAFRLGARVAPGSGYQGSRIREAVTAAFHVKDREEKESKYPSFIFLATYLYYIYNKWRVPE